MCGQQVGIFQGASQKEGPMTLTPTGSRKTQGEAKNCLFKFEPIQWGAEYRKHPKKQKLLKSKQKSPVCKWYINQVLNKKNFFKHSRYFKANLLINRTICWVFEWYLNQDLLNIQFLNVRNHTIAITQ